jgi:hypothetical protein
MLSAGQLVRWPCRLAVRPEDLAAAAVRDLLAAPAPDFQAAARRVLAKNEELYRRLA